MRTFIEYVCAISFNMYTFPVEVSRYKNLHRRCFEDILSKAARYKGSLFNQKKNTIEIRAAKKHNTGQENQYGAWIKTMVPVENFDHFGGSLGSVHRLFGDNDCGHLCTTSLDQRRECSY